ncbi:hypothetical protein [Rhizobium sp. BT-226]|uniref:hypothetical protein n=1 Tax=Rhizobium sp. BT-226 TaxID=2986922 RepID=UPI0021F7BD88|nr:hypothetical protein [Rhizobium sp. BT-226]MCW0018307.1 hypothetical protein [Rhizobium sp. BT-226]
MQSFYASAFSFVNDIRARIFPSKSGKLIGMEYSLSEKLERIYKCAQNPASYGIERSLLHAYIACLTFDELCEAICSTLEAEAPLRMALRGRLLRLLRLSDGELAERLSLLAEKAQSLHEGNHVLRTRVDALLSAVYSWLPLPIRHAVLERWIDRGTSGAAGRWLKAMASDAPLFDAKAIFEYWLESRNTRAAKILAYQAEPTFLDGILAELAAGCAEGWIISKAALRSTSIPDDIWHLLRDKHPASYAYLCAMAGRKLTDEEALALIEEAPSSILDDGRGLVIWSIGQMGLISALDRLGANRETYDAQRVAAILGSRQPTREAD